MEVSERTRHIPPLVRPARRAVWSAQCTEVGLVRAQIHAIDFLFRVAGPQRMACALPPGRDAVPPTRPALLMPKAVLNVRSALPRSVTDRGRALGRGRRDLNMRPVEGAETLCVEGGRREHTHERSAKQNRFHINLFCFAFEAGAGHAAFGWLQPPAQIEGAINSGLLMGRRISRQ